MSKLFNVFEEEFSPEKKQADFSVFDEEFRDTPYSTINQELIGTENNEIPGIESESEAIKFAGSMGFADTYRGLKQLSGFDEEEMKADQAKLNRILANKDFGGKAFAAYVGGVVADPFGWVIPIAKAKSVTQLVKQGIAYGAGFGAAGYVDEDGGQDRLTNAGYGAVSGGLITGTIGLTARKYFGFDDVPKDIKDRTDEQVIQDSVSARLKRRQAEQLNLKTLPEKMTLTQSYSKQVGQPLYNKMVKNPLGVGIGVATGLSVYNYLEDANSAEEYMLNTGLTIAAFFAGKGIVNKLRDESPLFKNTEDSFLYNLNPDIKMKDEVLKSYRDAKGGLNPYIQGLSNLHDNINSLNKQDAKVFYQIASGDLGTDELTKLSKGERVYREMLVGEQKKARNLELTKEEKQLRKAGATEKVDVTDYLGITVPNSVKKILDLNDEKIEVFNKLSSDMRKHGLLDDDIFRTNLDSYLKREYDNVKEFYGDGVAKKFAQNIGKIRGDSLKRRGVDVGQELDKNAAVRMVSRLRAERKLDYKIKTDYEKKYKESEIQDLVPKEKIGKFINRVEDEADPDFIKGKNQLDQPSNYGVQLTKTPDGKYNVTAQLTKTERIQLKELEDAALSVRRTMSELETGLGLSKFYDNLFEVGKNKGFVLTKDRIFTNELNKKNIIRTNRVDSKGNPIYSNSKTQAIEDEMNLIRTRIPDVRQTTETGVGAFPFQGLKRYNDLKKQLASEQKKVANEAKTLQKNADNFFKKGNDEYVKVPDTKTPDGVNQYGRLNGTTVTKDVYRDIQNLTKIQNDEFWRKGLLNKYLGIQRFWKKTKTVYNPAVHVNNFVANFSMYYMSNGSWKTFGQSMKDWGKLLDYEKGKIKYEDLPQDIKDLSDRAGMSFDFLSAELKGSLNKQEFINSYKIGQADKDGDWINSALDSAKYSLKNAKKIFGKYADKPLSNYYQMEDKVFRYALYKTRLQQVNPNTGRLYTKDEAANDAIKYFIDYDIRSTWTNNLRNSIVPFLSYSYRVIPLLLETAVVRPEKFAVMGAIGYLLNDGFRIAAESTKKEERQQRELMNEYRKKDMFGLSFMPYANVRLPYNAQDGGAKYFDFSRKLPGSDVFELTGTSPNGIEFLPAVAQPGGPIVDVYDKLLRGTDPFTGQKYEEFGMTKTEILGSRLKELGKSFVPNVIGIPGQPATNKFKRSMVEEYQSLSDPLTPWEAIANSFGLTINTADIERLQVLRALDVRSTESKYGGFIRRLEKKRMKGEITLEEYKEEFQKARQKLKEEFEGILE